MAQVNTEIGMAPPTPETHCTTVLYIAGLDECFCPHDGWTALHLTFQEGKVHVIRLLTEAKAHINIQTKVHIHCVMWSTDFDSLTSVNILNK